MGIFFPGCHFAVLKEILGRHAKGLQLHTAFNELFILFSVLFCLFEVALRSMELLVPHPNRLHARVHLVDG